MLTPVFFYVIDRSPSRTFFANPLVRQRRQDPARDPAAGSCSSGTVPARIPPTPRARRPGPACRKTEEPELIEHEVR